MNIKGRYIATVTFDFDCDTSSIGRTFEDIRNDVLSGVLTSQIAAMLTDEVGAMGITVSVEQQFADIYLQEVTE